MVISVLLLIPLGALVYLYVGRLNNELAGANDSLEALRWVNRINEVRQAVMVERGDTPVPGVDAIEALLEEQGKELLERGVLTKESYTDFGRLLDEWDINPGRNFSWSKQVLLEANRRSTRVVSILGNSLGVGLQDGEIHSSLLLSLPRFSMELYLSNTLMLGTLRDGSSESILGKAMRSERALFLLLPMRKEFDALVANLSLWDGNGDLGRIRLHFDEAFEQYEFVFNELLEKKRRLSSLGPIEGGDVSEAEAFALWKQGMALSNELLDGSKILEAALEKRVLAYRKSIITNRNTISALAGSIAILAVLLAYYVTRNISVAHRALREQNQSLEKAKAKAEEAALRADREREYALSLNRDLEDKTEHSNVLAGEAIAAKQAKSDFLATMSHEIRTPLNGVIGITSLLRDSDLGSAERGYVETLSSCTETLLALVNDVLDISKIEAGKVSIEQVEVDLVELTSGIASLFAPNADEKGLDFLCMYPAFFDRKVCCDPFRLRQVFSNLINNAIKFTHSGDIRFEVDIEEISQEEVVVYFSVSDTGIGISPEGKETLFESFSQVDASTSREFGGTGLGLAISGCLVDLMGSELLVESEEGVGSKFRFILKLKKGGIIEPPRVPPVKDLGRVLVLTESELIGRHIVDLVRSIEGRCYWVEKWEPEIEKGVYQNIFIESGLLESNRERLVSLKSQYPESRLFVIGRHQDNEVEEAYRELGIEGVFSAPYDPMALMELLQSVRGESAPAAPKKEAEEMLFANLSVLLVDDNEINLLVATEFLRKYGVDAVASRSGKDALKACENQRFDLIFMDCMMPELDGYETTRAIRSNKDGVNCEVPIIALTANAMKGDREICLDAGMSDYVAKPLEAKEIERVFERWIDFSEKRSENAQEIEEPETEALELLDISRFRGMFANDDVTFTAFVASFVETMNKTVAQLEKEISETQDLEEMRILSGFLKGSSASYGARHLNHAASSMERACSQGKIDEAIDLFKNVKQFSARTEVALQEVVD